MNEDTSVIITKKKVLQLRPAEYNPRVITDEMIEKLKNSLLELGYVDLIIWNKRSDRIVGGHQRVRAMLELGWGDKEIDVIVVDYDEPRERAANIALNKITGDWDMKKLAEVLDALPEDYQELAGFETEEIETLQESMIEQMPDVGSPPEDAIYQFGKHKVYFGSTRDMKRVGIALQSIEPSIVFADRELISEAINYWQDETGELPTKIG